jgi:signal peptidase I
MGALTGVILGGLVAYLAAWYLGLGGIEGNMALLLLLATVVTGAYWVAERFWFSPQRRSAAEALARAAAKRREELTQMGIAAPEQAQSEADLQAAQAAVLAQPWWLDWTAGLFPVIVTVFVLRSFLFEPFKIPSGSMIPTLLVGDLILVNKFTYGLRLPVFNTKITEGTAPQRGDVMVFRYPPKPSLDYIKRVVGVPGDTITYMNKQLSVNGQPVSKDALPDFFDEDMVRYFKQYHEQLGAHSHGILNDPDRPAFIAGVNDFQFRGNCEYTIEGLTCKVPEGHYFMMGDNRDNSLDSRYWGFVPDANIVGKAVMVWMNFSHPKRIGTFD